MDPAVTGTGVPTERDARDERVRAGKSRANARALGSTLLMLGTLGLISVLVLRYGFAIGLQVKHLIYVAVLGMIIVGVERERRKWASDHRERVERRRRSRTPLDLRADVPPAPASGPVGERPHPVRAGPHPAHRPVDMWWRKLLIVFVLLICALGLVGALKEWLF